MKGRYPLLVGGKHLETPDLFDVINPYDGSVVAAVSRASEKEAAAAVEYVDGARDMIASMPSHKKIDILRNVSNGILKKKAEIAEAITLESGKPVSASRVEVDRGALTFSIAADEVSRTGGELIPLDMNTASEQRWGIARRFPAGPVFGISPFNFPLNLVAHKIAPSIAAGNPVILKPASKTPITALMLGDIIVESGLPEGCLSVLPCAGKVVEKIITDARIRVFSFTGSVPVGWRLKSVANDKKVILELGGNAGVVIDEDCNLETAVDRCVTGAFAYSGQVCISVQRIYIHEKVYDRFEDLFLRKVESLKMGDPRDDSVTVGPMIDEENLERVSGWVNEAVENGASVLVGGRRIGKFYEPTVLSGTDPEMKVSCMEVFAPVVTLSKVESFEKGLDGINDSDFGLQAGVFTESLKRAHRAFEVLEVGGVIVNDVPTYRVDHMPYGGVKMSGFGREGLRYTIEEMTEPRLMVLNLK